jgi:hypothetical protein
MVAGIILTLCASVCFSEDVNGFRGLEWGVNISSTSGMQFVRTVTNKPDLKYYARPTDKLTFGDTPVSYIQYGFWKDQLYEIQIECDGDAHAALETAVEKKYGTAAVDSGQEQYCWSFPKTWISLRLDKGSHKAKLTFTSLLVNQAMAAYNKKAKETAKE